MALTALVFIFLLVSASITVSLVSAEWIKPVRMVGPAVRRWSGYILILVGGWFLLLAILPSPAPF